MTENYTAMGPDSIQALWAECARTYVKKDGQKVLSEVNFTKDKDTKLEGLTKDYENLDNLPAIGGTKLRKNTTWKDLGLGKEIQSELNNYSPKVDSQICMAFDPTYFGESTQVEWFTVNHMVTMRLTVDITNSGDITTGVPIMVFTEQVPQANDDGWKHLGRYSDLENVILEFWVNSDGELYMTSLGQLPSNRVYETCFTYIAK